ncbi:undecaprenyl-diphosphatase [Lachnospiraceae bacterium RM5]|nr:undecaprenyl-diphosphatase [Lachnospiraceae bacterium RM5]
MSLFETIIMGILQGVAEFLPISSSGHLAIFKSLFGLKEVGLAYDTLLHLGTLVAVFVVYWKDIWELILEGLGIVADVFRNIARFFTNIFSKNERGYIRVIDTPYRKFVMLVIVSTIPTGIIGMVFEKSFNMDSPSIIIPGIGLLITGLMLFIIDELPQGNKTERTATYTDSIILGMAQGVATLPGISRSGTTTTFGVLCGLKREFAIKYSFIMSIPAILGACILNVKDLFEPGNAISGTQWVYYIVGAITAAVVGYISIRTLIVLYKKKKMKYFSYYCFTAGLISIIIFFIK